MNFITEILQFKRYFLYFLKRNLEIVPIDADEKELGYTTNDCMHIAEEHEIMDGLTKDEKKMFRLGVFTHEMLHHFFTDFKILQDYLKKCNPIEKRVLSTISNIIEDPCIEYFAYTKLGGLLLRALDFTIAVIYDKAPNLEESPNPFSQYINALVMFGDMGLIKGKFTYPEAEEVFKKSAKLFSEGITEKKMSNRMEIAVSLMNLSRPLWDFEDEDKSKETIQQANDSLKNQGKNPKDMSNSMNGTDPTSSPTSEKMNQKQKNRQNTMGQMQKQSDGASDSTDEGNAMSANKTDGNGADEAESSFNLDDYRPTDGDIEEYDNVLKGTNKGELKSKLREVPSTVNIYESVDVDYADAKRKDIDKRQGNEDKSIQYAEVLSQVSSTIVTLYQRLKRIFLSETMETEHRSKGRMNMKRIMVQRPTTRLFDKRKQPKNRQDMVVAIAVDESGSMTAQKVRTARKMAIILCEVFKKFDIPVTVIGYTNGQGYDAVHNLYVGFSNTRKERECLMKTGSYNCNFDAYTVRYMSELLKTRKEEHKLVIVISDGQPSFGGKDPIRATKEAVDNSRKDGIDVLGVSIYNDDEKILKSIYGEDFIHGNEEKKVITDFVSKIRKYIKK